MNGVSHFLKAYPSEPHLWKGVFFQLHDHFHMVSRLISEKSRLALQAQDWCSQKRPSRLGIFLKSYDPGDPLKTLSKRLWVLTQKAFVKLDEDLSQKSVALVWCHSPSLSYLGPQDEVPHGVLSLFAADYLKSFHLRQGHRVSLFWLKPHVSLDFLKGVSWNQFDQVALIGDGLWFESWQKSWACFELLWQRNFWQKFQIFQVRSRSFLLQENPFAEEGWSFLPFQDKVSWKSYDSGSEYLERLKEEESRLTKWLQSFYNLRLFWVDCGQSDLLRVAQSF